MIKRLNYTGRAKIRRADVKLSTRGVGAALSFDAVLCLNHYELPGDALVFVEAYRQTEYMRFEFGTVAALRPPANRLLSEFSSPDGIHFRVKVTQAANEHVLLAEADRVPLALPDDPTERESLLPVFPSPDLGDELWRLDFSQEPPELAINKAATEDWRALAQSPLFVGLVYPAVLRELLTRIVVHEQWLDTDDEEDWRSRWLRFASLLPGMTEPPSKEDSQDQSWRWINDAVAAFARRLEAKSKFTTAWQKKEAA